MEWLFKDKTIIQDYKKFMIRTKEIETLVQEIKNKLDAMVEHTELFEKYLPHKNFNIMKKHYKAYVNGFDGAKELREKLMQTQNAQEVSQTVKEWITNR